MNSVPECAFYINEEEREDELTPTEQCLYDMFARVYVETGSVMESALRIGYKNFIARERGKQIYEHGFTRRRIAHIKNSAMSEDEQLALANNSIRTLSQEMNSSFESKNRIAAATSIFKIHHIKHSIANPNAVGADRSGVMEVEPMPLNVDAWGEEASAQQAQLKDSARD